MHHEIWLLLLLLVYSCSDLSKKKEDSVRSWDKIQPSFGAVWDCTLSCSVAWMMGLRALSRFVRGPSHLVRGSLYWERSLRWRHQPLSICCYSSGLFLHRSPVPQAALWGGPVMAPCLSSPSQGTHWADLPPVALSWRHALSKDRAHVS